MKALSYWAEKLLERVSMKICYILKFYIQTADQVNRLLPNKILH